MKTLLVTFQDNTDVIGLKYIHSYLCKKQIDSHILFIPKYDKKHNPSIERFLKGFQPKIIGISLMSPEFDNAKEFSIFIKNRFPEIILVWGGIHPTIEPKECLNYADYIFKGESEQAFFEFVDAISKNKPVNDILNIGYKSSGEIVINKLRLLNENLDDLPFPEHFPQESFVLHNGNIVKLNKPLFKKYARNGGTSYDIITSRGCPFSCAYCCNSVFQKLYGANKIRKRSVERVIEEIRQAIKSYPEIFFINIQDDNFFSYDVQWMKDFAEAYEREIKKNFVCRTTPTHFDEEKFSILRKAGLSWLVMGLQSGSPRINKEIYNRFATNEKFIEATKIVRKYNSACYYDVILDNPYETEQDTIKTIEVILEIPKPFMLQLFSLVFYQGTKIYDKAINENIIFEDPHKKNFVRYRQTFLNRVIRLSPLLPKNLIRLMVKNRKSYWAKILLNLIYLPSILILEPLVWLRLILISFDYNISATINMILAFSKLGFSKVVLRK
ncbi:radical SAM protein [archaeon]|nr:MAG: radical SAM protein [archaeon]